MDRNELPFISSGDNAERLFTLFIVHAGSPQPDENTILMPVEERTRKMESTVHHTSGGVQHSIQPHSQVMYMHSLQSREKAVPVAVLCHQKGQFSVVFWMILFFFPHYFTFFFFFGPDLSKVYSVSKVIRKCSTGKKWSIRDQLN